MIICLTAFLSADWIMEPEGFEDGVTIINGSYGNPSYWFAPDYRDPLYVYSPGFESDSAVGSGAMSWPDWWGNFIRTPIQDCSSADSVVLSFRMWNSADPSDNDYARFYVWVGPDVGGAYFGTTTISMGPGHAREWELMNIDFTEYAAGQSQVYFYLETNFGTGSFTRECKFDDIGVATNTVLDVAERRDLPEEISIYAYPNPFNSSITISIDCGSESANRLSTIEIFDVNGRQIAVIARPQVAAISSNQGDCFVGQSPPRNDSVSEFIWTPDEQTVSGVYLVRATVGSNVVSKRVVHLK